MTDLRKALTPEVTPEVTPQVTGDVDETAKREWVGLTDAQVEEITEYHGIDGLYETSRIDFYRAIEITLKDNNE
jgi:hypothetical protein